MLLQSLLSPGGLNLLQMGIGVLYGFVLGDDTGCCLLPDGRHPRYIVGGIPHKSLHINEFLRSHLILLQHIRREIVLNLGHTPAGPGNPYLDVLISQLQKVPVTRYHGYLDALGLTPLCHGSQYIIRLKPLKGHDGNSHGLQHILHHGNLLMKLLGHGLSRALIGVIHLMPEGRLL